jgi:hypothetical protein
VVSAPPDTADGTDWHDGATLGQLVETLGPLALHVESAPRGLDVVVGEPVIQDLGERVLDQADGMLLVVGGAPDDPVVLDAIKQAGAARYAAVVLKARGRDLAAAAQAAQDAETALLIAPDDMPWRHLDALITAASDATGPARASYAEVGAGDLFSLANAIAYSVGGAITIEDPQGHVLAYSNLPHQDIDTIRQQGILGRITPDRPTNDAHYQRVCRADGPVRFKSGDPEHTARVAVAVRAGPQVLGLIWAIDGTPPLGEGASEALEEAAKITALHLLRARAHRNPDRWSRGEALASLLDGATTGRVASAQLGIGIDTPTCVLAIAHAADDETPGLGSARIVDLVSLYCEAWHPQALCTTAGDLVYALIPTRIDPGAERRVTKFAHDVAATVLRTAGLVLHVGIGAPSARLDEVVTGRRSADRVLRALAADVEQVRVATVEEVRSRVLLLELAERGAASIDVSPDPVRDIIEHDRQHGTDYAHSLLAFLDAFGEAARASAELSVHENTLRYRIRRIQELFELDLDDPDTRLVTWLQLRMQQISE